MANNTVFGAYNDTKEKLKAAGIEDYGFEARVVMRHVTGLNNKEILLNYNTPLTTDMLLRLHSIVNRRAQRYPLQYILGEWEFYGLTLSVGEGVLIPRADTETAVDTALELIKGKEAPSVLDLCAGSGAIGLSIAVNRADSRVGLLEKYPAAAEYLKVNIKRNAPDNAYYLPGDVLRGDGAENGKFDLIVSNPPYISDKDMKTLQPEVLCEPPEALFGGDDGLAFYRAIAENYKSAINTGGAICFEVGFGEAEAVKQILLSAGFEDVKAAKDLSGIDRVVFGTVRQYIIQ